MNRRTFLQGASTAGVAAGLVPPAHAYIPEHNWDKYDWGSGPEVEGPLVSGPFSTVRARRRRTRQRRGHGDHTFERHRPQLRHGINRLCLRRHGPTAPAGETLEKSLEDLVKIPFTQKIYIRPNWREVQRKPGRLDFPDWWQVTFDLAKRYNKRVGFRIMLENPDFAEPGMPEFLMKKVPYLKLKGEWKGNPSLTRYKKEHRMPQYEHPAYQAAFRELNGLLAAELNGKSAGRVHGYDDVRFLGRSAHLAL